MVFNSNSDSQDLVSLMNDFSNGDANTFPIKQKTRLANKALREIWSWIFESYGGWIYDDGNNTSDFPIALASLVSGQKDYSLPTSALDIHAIEVKDTSGNWTKLKPITLEEILTIQAENEFQENNGNPIYYRLIGNNFKTYPASNYSQTNSLRVSFTRGSTAFASTDTTKEPGFASEFHEAVAIGASKDFAQIKSLPSFQGLLLQWRTMENRIKKFYTERYYALYPKRIIVSDMVKENL